MNKRHVLTPDLHHLVSAVYVTGLMTETLNNTMHATGKSRTKNNPPPNVSNIPDSPSLLFDSYNEQKPSHLHLSSCSAVTLIFDAITLNLLGS